MLGKISVEFAAGVGSEKAAVIVQSDFPAGKVEADAVRIVSFCH
jgi:hypothetical protein